MAAFSTAIIENLNFDLEKSQKNSRKLHMRSVGTLYMRIFQSFGANLSQPVSVLLTI